MAPVFTSPRRARTVPAASLATLALVLAACGGGGGGGGGGTAAADHASSAIAAAVEVQYPATLLLWRATDVLPTTSGLSGAAPTCTLTGGALPPGLTFAPAGCRVSGVPTQGGVYTIRYQVAATTLTVPAEKTQTLVVLAPPVTYNLTGMLEGQPVRVEPVSDNCCAPWAPAAGETLAYAVTAGALPPGLALDAATGVLHGILAGAATGDFTIGVQAVSSGREFRADSGLLHPLTAPGLEFTYARPQALAGVAFDSGAPQASWPAGMPPVNASYGDFRLAAGSAPLPAGLWVDAATGAIRGTPAAAGAALVTIDAGVQAQGETGRFTFTAPVSVQ